ncbi:unnamed protein product [Chrysoparadoxa australica]
MVEDDFLSELKSIEKAVNVLCSPSTSHRAPLTTLTNEASPFRFPSSTSTKQGLGHSPLKEIDYAALMQENAALKLRLQRREGEIIMLKEMKLSWLEGQERVKEFEQDAARAVRVREELEATVTMLRQQVEQLQLQLLPLREHEHELEVELATDSNARSAGDLMSSDSERREVVKAVATRGEQHHGSDSTGAGITYEELRQEHERLLGKCRQGV